MLTESYFSSVSGPPITNNTAVAKDVGIYEHTLHPSHATPSTFKKSSVPRHGLAVSDTHVFAAQDDKSTVHVYARGSGGGRGGGGGGGGNHQEAVVTFPERIRSVLLQGDVLFLGTQEGRIIVWEVCTGRQVTTRACHIQAVTCLAATPLHLLSGSDDSNVHVWSIPRLLALDPTVEHEPEQTLSNHRAAVTDVAAGPGVNPDTAVCVSASRDRSCIVWNYQQGAGGVALRTLLFPAAPLCVSLDPCARALYASAEDGSVYAVDLFGTAEKPSSLLGPQGVEESGAGATAIQVSSAFGAAPPEAGPASCLAVSYDGTVLLSGHPRGQILRWDLSSRADSTELANLNASVTNLVCVSPLPPSAATATRPVTVVRPFLGSRTYNFTAQLTSDIQTTTATGGDGNGGDDDESRFAKMLGARGFPAESLQQAILALQQPTAAGDVVGDQELRTENEELWEIINEQRALQKKTLERYIEAKSTTA
ncbi:Pre-rRNA-processing protein ipi3 [Diatrype stigma]|uniref:Pre-rRNA-processing protein IPI3 n=1 Tax=Diatrype stigma TaxID=117547 RepID=A0AAN9YUC7_9PEZI